MVDVNISLCGKCWVAPDLWPEMESLKVPRWMTLVGSRPFGEMEANCSVLLSSLLTPGLRGTT